MEIEFKPIKESEYDSLFQVVKEGLYHHIDAVFGWDDEFQHSRLRNSYQFDWFYWVYCQGKKVGMLCYKPYDNAMHVHLLVIFPSMRGQSYGSRIMEKIKVDAICEQREKITLSSFIVNQQAVRFYQTLGYQITDREEDFYTFALQL